MKHVVFYRNLNLGRPRCPNRSQLEDAFLASGADSASSFLSNGTLVFSVKHDSHVPKIVASASESLLRECGLTEPAFVRRMDHLREVVALDPFSDIDRSNLHECCVTFLHHESVTLLTPLASMGGDVEILRFTDGEALSVSRKIGRNPGSPNAFLERLMGWPATTRSWNTVSRLVERYG